MMRAFGVSGGLLVVGALLLVGLWAFSAAAQSTQTDCFCLRNERTGVVYPGCRSLGEEGGFQQALCRTGRESTEKTPGVNANANAGAERGAEVLPIGINGWQRIEADVPDCRPCDPRDNGGADGYFNPLMRK